MQEIKCPECGAVNTLDSKECNNCGYPFDEIIEEQIKQLEEKVQKEKLAIRLERDKQIEDAHIRLENVQKQMNDVKADSKRITEIFSDDSEIRIIENEISKIQKETNTIQLENQQKRERLQHEKEIKITEAQKRLLEVQETYEKVKSIEVISDNTEIEEIEKKIRHYENEIKMVIEKMPVDKGDNTKMYNINDNEKKEDDITMPDDAYENSVANTLKIIAIAIYVMGTIGACIMANVDNGYSNEFSLSLFFSYEFYVIVCGTVFIGFAEIIRLLQYINQNIVYFIKLMKKKF